MIVGHLAVRVHLGGGGQHVAKTRESGLSACTMVGHEAKRVSVLPKIFSVLKLSSVGNNSSEQYNGQNYTKLADGLIFSSGAKHTVKTHQTSHSTKNNSSHHSS